MTLINPVPKGYFSGSRQISHSTTDPRTLWSILNELIDSVNAGFSGDMKMLQPVDCLASAVVGDWMAIRGDRDGARWRVQKADISDVTKMPAVGVLVSKSSATTGLIQVLGPCGIFTGLDYTKPVAWLGVSGIQYVMPDGPAFVQRVGKAVASDVFWISGSLEMMEVI